MNKEKNKNGIIALLVVIIIILVFLVVLAFTGTLKFNKIIKDTQSTNQTTNDNPSSNEKTTEESTSNDFNTIDINKLDYNGKDISDGNVEHIYINRDDSINLDYDFSVYMTLSGKIKVITTDENGNSFNEYLSNINKATDIIHFSVAGAPEEQFIYILLANGDVYYYRVGDSIEKKYMATKLDNISKVKKLFIYNEGKSNAGGSWELVAITEDNKCVMLKKESV